MPDGSFLNEQLELKKIDGEDNYTLRKRIDEGEVLFKITCRGLKGKEYDPSRNSVILEGHLAHIGRGRNVVFYTLKIDPDFEESDGTTERPIFYVDSIVWA